MPSNQGQVLEEAVERLLVEDPDLAAAVQSIRRAVDETTLDEAVEAAVHASVDFLLPALRKQFAEELAGEFERRAERFEAEEEGPGGCEGDKYTKETYREAATLTRKWATRDVVGEGEG
jgi:hypothetical protein